MTLLCRSSFSANFTVTDPNDWTMDTYAQYADFVYVSVPAVAVVASSPVICDASCDSVSGQSIPNNGTITPAYEAQAQYLCRSQVALAGYRLAALMDSLFGVDSSYVDLPQPHLRGASPASLM